MENRFQGQVGNNINKAPNQVEKLEILYAGLGMWVFVMELEMLFILIMKIIILEEIQLLMFLNGIIGKF